MSRPRFLADHDLNEHILDGLLRREPGIEVIRSREAAIHGLPDDEVLAYAAERGLLTVSHDVNTMTAAAFARIEGGKPMAGLLMAPQFAAVASVIDSLVLIWSASEAEEWNGVVAFLPL